MGAPALTYTLANSTTADAGQVMQNLNDLLNGYTDGTKDLTVASVTTTANVTIAGSTTLGNNSVDLVTVNGTPTFATPVTISNATTATSVTTGALKVVGGISTQENCYVGGVLNVAGITTLANTTDASSSTVGGVVVTGGLAVAKKAYVGTSLFVGTKVVIGSTSAHLDSPVGIVNNAGIKWLKADGSGAWEVYISNTDALIIPVSTNVTGNLSTDGAANTFSNATDATASTNGVVRVAGGMGIAKKLFVGTVVGIENQGELRLYEATAGGSNYVGFKAAAALAGNKIWELPIADGTANQFMKTDGSGALAFTSIATLKKYSLVKGATTAIPNNADTTIIFPTEDYDSANAYNPLTGEYTVPTTGLLTVHSAAKLDVTSSDWSAGEFFRVAVAVNGTVVRQNEWVSPGTATLDPAVSVTAVLQVTAADVVTVKAFQNSGNTYSLTSSGQDLYNYAQFVLEV